MVSVSDAFTRPASVQDRARVRQNRGSGDRFWQPKDERWLAPNFLSHPARRFARRARNFQGTFPAGQGRERPESFAGVAKLADAPDLGSGAARRGGSSPFTRTRGTEKDDNMQVTETLNEGLKRGYTITVTAAELDAKVQEKLIEAQPEIEMKGFRKGKVPLAILRKQFGPRLLGDAMQEAIDGAMKAHFDSHRRPPGAAARSQDGRRRDLERRPGCRGRDDLRGAAGDPGCRRRQDQAGPADREGRRRGRGRGAEEPGRLGAESSRTARRAPRPRTAIRS